MRHPYGIWNFKSALSRQGRNIMRHPYGIWNPSGRESAEPSDNIMRHPYGIWNTAFSYKVSIFTHYETSLWDLKLCRMIQHRLLTRLWDIPMGFETNCKGGQGIAQNTLWDIPMGFETDKQHNQYDENVDIMRHPYGIWNIWLFRSYSMNPYIMRHPYGIWNYNQVRHDLKDVYYETSLWDLKLVWCRKINKFVWIMRHPYGIWNLHRSH